MSVRELHTSLVSDTDDGGIKYSRDEYDNTIISDVVVNVEFLLKSYIHNCYPSVKGIWKNSKIKIQNAQIIRSGEKQYHIYET